MTKDIIKVSDDISITDNDIMMIMGMSIIFFYCKPTETAHIRITGEY